MVQIPKNHIKQAILDAALYEFAERGFAGASVAVIAARAQVSTGNVYRYFKGKAQLFDSVVSLVFVNKLKQLIQRRIEAYPIGLRLEDTLDDMQYKALSQELLEFVIAYRLQVLILLEGAKGTPYELFAKELSQKLTEKAIENLNFADNSKNNRIARVLIADIYNNFLSGLGVALRKFSKPTDIAVAIEFITGYHLGGLETVAK